jgi:hypothetical protein
MIKIDIFFLLNSEIEKKNLIKRKIMGIKMVKIIYHNFELNDEI